MKFEKTEVWGFEHAIRGMRNPFDSWNLSDSVFCNPDGCNFCENIGKCENMDWYEDDFSIGDKDLELMQKLIKAGSEHRKFMRQIMVSVDITAPLYWWKEFDTYKVGTVADSTSTMHKLASTPITIDCFEMDDAFDVKINILSQYVETITDVWVYGISVMEFLRQKYNETKDKRYWKELIRLLPESWLQTRTVTMNYENVLSMYRQRQNHKLSEWSEDFVSWVDSLPYADELLKI